MNSITKSTITSLQNEVGSRATQFRNLIEKSHTLMTLMNRDDNKWAMVCCSQDTIEDLLVLQDEYMANYCPRSKYTFFHSIMGSFMVQQDAMTNLSGVFATVEYINPKIQLKTKEIRRLRNSATGHPTNQKNNTIRTQISRITMEKHEVQIIISSKDGEKFEMIDIYKCMRDQLDFLLSSYKKLIFHIEKEDKMHKEKYKDESLVDILKGIGNHISAIGHNNDIKSVCNIRSVQRAYDKFKTALLNRGEYATPYAYTFDIFVDSLSKLASHFNENGVELTKNEVIVHQYYLSGHHKEFEEIAKEIDDRYADSNA